MSETAKTEACSDNHAMRVLSKFKVSTAAIGQFREIKGARFEQSFRGAFPRLFG
jgi:hypothetical protein